jgi:hypothetical protein
VLIRGPGRGKSHIATALGVQAIEHHRKKVSFFSTVDLVNALEQEKAANWAGQLADRLLRLDLVILDELAAWFQQIDGERIDVIKTPFLAMWNDAVAKEVAGDTTFPSRQIGDATQTFVMSGMSARASHFEHLLGHVLGLHVLGLHVLGLHVLGLYVLGLYVLALDVARLGGVLAIDPTGRAMICVPRMWLASWIRLTGASTSRSDEAQAAAGPQAAGQISPWPRMFAAMAAGRTPVTAEMVPSSVSSTQNGETLQGIGRYRANRGHDCPG